MKHGFALGDNFDELKDCYEIFNPNSSLFNMLSSSL